MKSLIITMVELLFPIYSGLIESMRSLFPVVTQPDHQHTGKVAMCFQSGRGRQIAMSFLMGTVLAVLVYLRIKNFLNVNFDGWSYWEGAIAIANAKGYADLLGKPIIAFPPLFSVFLSLFAKDGIVSLGSVKVALVSLAWMNGFVWSWLAQREFSRTQSIIRWFAVCTPILIFPVYFDMIMSEPLWLLLSGLLLWVTLHWQTSWLSSFLIMGLLSLCLLTRNVSVAMIPSLPLLVLPRTGFFEARRITLLSLCSLAPWLVYRRFTGSMESHRYGFSFWQLPTDFQSSFVAMSRDFSNSRAGLAPLALGIFIIAISCILINRGRTGRWGESSGRPAGWLLFSVSMYSLTTFVSHLTMVGAGQSRFYILSLVSSIFTILLTASLSRQPARTAMIGLLACLFLTSSVYRNGFFAIHNMSLPPADDSFTPSRTWLEKIHRDVQLKTSQGSSLEAALSPYPISVLRYQHWMGIPYPLQSH